MAASARPKLMRTGANPDRGSGPTRQFRLTRPKGNLGLRARRTTGGLREAPRMLKLGRKFLQRLTEPADRRTHKRLRAELRAVCRPVADDREVAVWVEDVSRGGIKLRVGEALREGTMIRLELPRAGSEPSTTVLACVMHVGPAGPDWWEVGCNFSLELSESELRAFGGRKSARERGDERAWVRHPARGAVEFRVLPGDNGPPRTGQLVNLSAAGVGLILTEALEPGSALTVTLKREDQQPDRSLLACVVYQTRRADGKWAVGCNFLHELSEKELDELLWHSAF